MASGILWKIEKRKDIYNEKKTKNGMLSLITSVFTYHMHKDMLFFPECQVFSGLGYKFEVLEGKSITY